LAPGSRSRNERGALPVSKFKAIGRKLWPASAPVSKSRRSRSQSP
jgi:hypothetical protein